MKLRILQQLRKPAQGVVTFSRNCPQDPTKRLTGIFQLQHSETCISNSSVRKVGLPHLAQKTKEDSILHRGLLSHTSENPGIPEENKIVTGQ